MNSSPDRTPKREPPGGSELPPATLDGWYVLHQVFRIDWRLLKNADPTEVRDALKGVESLLDSGSNAPEDGWSGAYRMVGCGVDLMLLHFRSSMDELMAASHSIASSDFADFLELDHEFLSVVELGLYPLTVEVSDRVDPSDHEAYRAALDEALEEQRGKAYVQRRLYPRQPDDLPYVSYYPMDKRREHDNNWYALPLHARAELMKAHGTIGRRYAGRISQVISGSVGLADWEWAVTLWAADPLAFKEIVTEMRYDQASAGYADFGRFFVGRRMTPADFEELAG